MIEVGDTVSLPSGRKALVIEERTHDEVCRHLRVEVERPDQGIEFWWSVESDFTLVKKGNKNGEGTRKSPSRR